MSTTTTWSSSGSPKAGSWGDMYGWRSNSSDGVYQGDYGYGHYRGLWFFDDANIRSTLNNQRILSVKIYITRRNTSHGSTSAGTPTMRLHNYSSQPSGEPTMQSGTSSHGVSFARGDAKWVSLYNSWGEALRDGNSRGIGVYTTSNTPYLIFSENATLSITYEPELDPPPTPTNLHFNGSTTSSVEVDCDNASTATGYEWDRNGGGTAKTSSSVFNNTGLPAGTLDYWRVRAYNAAGSSNYTLFKAGKTKVATSGMPAQNDATTTSITMSWNPLTGANGYRVNGSDGTVDIGDGSITTLTWSNLSPGTAYTFRVKGTASTTNGTGGDGDYSSYRTMYTLCAAPGQPTASDIKDTKATISWGAVTGATSYEVQRRIGTGSWSTVRTQTGTSWTNTGLDPDVQYGYQVRAINSAGAGAYSAERTLTTVALPDVPTALSLDVIETHSLTISWSTASGAASYQVQRLDADLNIEQVWTGITGTSLVDTNVLPGGDYRYKVRSESSLGGLSDFSLPLIAQTNTMPQLAPTLTTMVSFNAVEDAVFEWTFNTDNINDEQDEAKITITDVVANTVAHTDTVAGSAETYTLTGGTLPNTNTEYSWVVETEDSFNTVFGPASTASTFETLNAPIVDITSPLDGDHVNDTDMTVNWTYSHPTTGQDEYLVRALTAGTTTQIYSSGWTASSATTHTFALAAGDYDIEVTVKTGTVDSLPDVSTNVALSAVTSHQEADTGLVYWSSNTGPGGTPAFTFEADGITTYSYHAAPTGDGWTQAPSPGTEEWDFQRDISGEYGTNIVLNIVAKVEDYTIDGITTSYFNLEVDVEDDSGLEQTISAGAGSIFAGDSIDLMPSTPLEDGFALYTLSVGTRFKALRARIASRFTIAANGVTAITLAEIDVHRSGRILSEEFRDTDRQRGLFLSGSGFMFGNSLELGGDSPALILGDTRLDSDGLVIDGGYLEHLKLTRTGTPDIELTNTTVNHGFDIHIGGTPVFNLSEDGDIDIDGKLDAAGLYLPGTSFVEGTGGTAGREYVVVQGSDDTDGTAPQVVVYGANDSSLPGVIALRPKGSGVVEVDGTLEADTVIVDTEGSQGGASFRLNSAGTYGMYGGGSFTALTAGGSHGFVLYSGYLWLSRGDVRTGTTDATSTIANDGATSGVGMSYSGSILAMRRDSVAFVINRTSSSTNSTSMLSMRYRGNEKGSIGVSSTSTAFNTSSDYRLKENDTEIAGAIEKVMTLRPIEFDWKDTDGPRATGFFAHEVQTVIPQATTGEKDAIDEDGNPVYQQVDYSKVVPLLTAALQKAIKRIDALEAR
ncbi:MAG: fibronectin type III domain-containing protein [Actinobacteria bacterium]|nr:fibronectin type III domain-containing protein [Actinomycetota bacterium]